MDERERETRPGEEEGMEVEEPSEDTVVEILSIGDEGESSAEPPATIAEEEVRRLREEADQGKERYLRLRADFDNFRKRIERERGEIERFASGELLRELLPVADNLERALAAPGEVEEVRRGVEMIHRQMMETLRRHGLASVPAVGARFDPAVHEAVTQEESEAVAVPTVVAELQRGYRLHERLLRPALVRVAMPRESAGGDAEDGGAENLPQA